MKNIHRKFDLSFGASSKAWFEKGLRINQNKEKLVEVMKKIYKFVPCAQSRLAKATSLVATVMYLYRDKVADRPLSALISLEPDRLAHLVPAPTPKVVVVSPLSPNEFTVTPASPPKELNEEWVDALINGPDEEMVDASVDKSVEVVVQGEDSPLISRDISAAPKDVPASSENDHTSHEAQGRARGVPKDFLMLRAWDNPTVDGVMFGGP
ncbi:hypothetical protein Tco_0410990 [Tanacetum coccineum]